MDEIGRLAQALLSVTDNSVFEGQERVKAIVAPLFDARELEWPCNGR